MLKNIYISTSIMEDINIILHGSITSFEVNLMSICLSIASCKPEQPTSTNNRHLSDAGKHIVSPQNAKGAAIILPFCENKVQCHQKTKFTLWCRCINPLCCHYFEYYKYNFFIIYFNRKKSFKKSIVLEWKK